jgi:hypothetical protein
MMLVRLTPVAESVTSRRQPAAAEVVEAAAKQPQVTAVGADSERLKGSASVARSSVITLHARGFLARETVKITVDGQRAAIRSTDGSGGLTYRFAVSRTLDAGRHNVAIVASDATISSPSPQRGTIAGTVPRLAVFFFLVKGSTPSAPVSSEQDQHGRGRSNEQ